jgi:hypothetical protein
MVKRGWPTLVSGRAAGAPDCQRSRSIATIDLLRPRQSYRHEAFFWRTADDFLAGTIPFIHDGLEADEPVMVAVIAERIALMQAALGEDATRVHFVDMAELGRNPAKIIPGWQRFLDGHSGGGQPMRGIGEPIWAGRRREEIVECQLHEALLNVAVDPELPFWLLCPYNSDLLDAGVIQEAHRSHPAVNEADIYRGSPLYGGRDHVGQFFGSSLPDLEGEPDQLYFNRTTLPRILPFVAARALTGGVAADQAADLAVSAYHAASSSLQRAALGGVVRFWQRPDAVICEVRDHSWVADPLAGRRLDSHGERDGLWLANQSCDLVQLRSTRSGTTVRMHHWTGRSAA